MDTDSNSVEGSASGVEPQMDTNSQEGGRMTFGLNAKMQDAKFWVLVNHPPANPRQ
jgi:hypothetical protein